MGEIKRRTKVTGRFPGETSCLSLCWVALDMVIADAYGLGITQLDQRELDRLRAEREEARAVAPSA